MDGHDDEWHTGMYGYQYQTETGGIAFVDCAEPLTKEEQARLGQELRDYQNMRKERLEKRKHGEPVLNDTQKMSIEELRKYMFGKG